MIERAPVVHRRAPPRRDHHELATGRWARAKGLPALEGHAAASTRSNAPSTLRWRMGIGLLTV